MSIIPALHANYYYVSWLEIAYVSISSEACLVETQFQSLSITLIKF
jgi:hypothetical protein